MNSPSPAKTAPFLARDNEVAVIEDAVRGLKQGQGSVLFFCGEPGIGKSTLARWASEFAQSQGLPTYWGFAWEAGGAPSYWPWTQLLRSFLNQNQSKDHRFSALSQILPELTPDQDHPEPNIKAEQARFRLMEAVRKVMSETSRGQPMVLVLEDLHACDNDSLQLLQFVVQHIQSMPILLIGTYRDTEARLSDHTQPLLRAARHARVLPLACLTRGEIREFLTRSTGEAPSDKQVSQLWSATEGNPLFMFELVGMLSRQETASSFVASLPGSLQQVIYHHLETLPDDAFQILEHASVIGREFDLTEVASLVHCETEDLNLKLQPAITADIIKPIEHRRYRFFHIFYRDVLYAALNSADLMQMHRKMAELLQRQVEAGQMERLSEWARHLDASGSKYRKQAVAAWRQAAQHARSRLAFEDAASSMSKALNSFGAGPDADPAERCELMIELAQLTLEKGSIEEGQVLCQDAFLLARTLEHAELAANAALTYGSVFVIANVDSNLISHLQEALANLPSESTGTRAKVMGRLAAALQPAKRPDVPMNMAREAIALARSTGDEMVLYSTLRSAISALMDFAPADERAALNREYASMAEKTGDATGHFRAFLRLTIDACELGDRHLMDESIENSQQIANRIGLPHYLWRVAAMRAMRSMLQGKFQQAESLIQEAENLAKEAQDSGAELTIPIQRFALQHGLPANNKRSSDQAAQYLMGIIERRPSLAPFIKPILANHLQSQGEAAHARAMCTPDVIKAAFTSGDRCSAQAIGKYALHCDDQQLAQSAYENLLPSSGRCGNLGTMGSVWIGPIDETLGELASAAGEISDARSHFHNALKTAESMGAIPSVIRIHHCLMKLEHDSADNARAKFHQEQIAHLQNQLESHLPEHELSEQSIRTHHFLKLTLEGEFWKIEYRSQTTLIKNSKGMQMLAKLVAQPGHQFHVLDLSSPGNTLTTKPDDAIPLLDEKARDDYRQRLKAIDHALEESEALNDIGRSEALREEKDFLTNEISRAFGLGGRARPGKSAAEKARVNVQRRLRDAINRITTQLPEAGNYLNNTVKTGSFCSYTEM